MQGDTLSARTSSHRLKAAKALVLEIHASSTKLTADGIHQQRIYTLHLIHGDGLFIPITELPSMAEATNEPDQNKKVLYAGMACVQARRLQFSNSNFCFQRPAWTESRPAVCFADNRNSSLSVTVLALICHICYFHDHTSLQFICLLDDMAKMVANYEAVTHEEKHSAPTASYVVAKTNLFHALPHSSRARYLRYPTKDSAQPSGHTH